MEKVKQISWIALIIIIIISASFYLYNKSNEPSIIWKIIDEKPFDKNILIDEVSTSTWEIDLEKIKKEEIELNKVKSMVRTLCNLWDIDTLIWTNSFKIIKLSIDEIKNNQENKEKFLFIDLPWIVYDSCPESDSTFLNRLLKYLQAEWISNIEEDKVDIAKYNLFLEDIAFDSTWIDKSKLKNDSKYFEQVFFKNNLEAIKSSYFSEYMFRSDDSDSFLNTKSILSLTETNDILEKTLWDFESFLKKIWLNWIEDFREYILKNNNFENIDNLKEELKNDYIKLQKIVVNEYEIDLNTELATTSSTATFYKTNYSKISENVEIKRLFNSIWNKYLLFSIVNTDYADWLDETWSGKEFFWDYLIWNGIIKIWFIYLYNSN